MANNDDHPFLVFYLAALFWCASVVLIGAVARLFHPSFSLWNWMFRGFPDSAFHPITWGKEAGVLVGALLIALLIMRVVFGVKPGRSRAFTPRKCRLRTPNLGSIPRPVINSARFGSKKPSGKIPTTVKGRASSTSVLPRIDGSPPKRPFHDA